MTLDEAHAHARELEADERFAVVAIGRFELIAELINQPAAAFPWGLSVVSRIDPNYKGVLRTRDELAEFVLLAPQPSRAFKPSPPAKPAASLPAQQSVFLFE